MHGHRDITVAGRHGGAAFRAALILLTWACASCYPGEKENAGAQFQSIMRERNPRKRLTRLDGFIKTFGKTQPVSEAYRQRLLIHACSFRNKAKTEEAAREWIRAEPQDANVLSKCAWGLLWCQANAQTALEYAQQAVDIERRFKGTRYVPDSAGPIPDVANKHLAGYLSNLAWALSAAGDQGQALAAAQEAVSHLPGSATIQYRLGLTYQALDEIDKAIDAYARSWAIRAKHQDAKKRLDELFEDRHGAAGSTKEHVVRRERLGCTFTDVTAASGLDGQTGRGQGRAAPRDRVAWGDYDGDGWQDLLVSGTYLWRNKGDGAFENVTRTAGLKGSANIGVWADFDNDGHLDFYAGGQSVDLATRDLLWRNNGDGTFTEVAESAGQVHDAHPTQAAAWGDYDADGHVDLYVANYEPAGRRARGTPDALYRNSGNGIFTNVTAATGMKLRRSWCGRGASWADFDNDGDLDLYVSNYRLSRNYLWENQGDGTFVDTAQARGVMGICNKPHNLFGHTIGSAWGDFDNDGHLDLFCANLAHPGRYLTFSDKSMLYRSSGPPDWTFADIRRASGILYEETHSNPTLGDFDADGDLDIFITSVYPKRPSFLYENLGGNRFRNVAWYAGVRTFNGWGSACCDYDNDGDLDLVVCNWQETDLKLYRNDGHDSSWLKVKLVGTDCNRAAIGARVTVTAGALTQIREVSGGTGTGCQDPLTQLFGFGNHVGPVTVEVRWPCKRCQTLEQVALNQQLEIVEQ